MKIKKECIYCRTKIWLESKDLKSLNKMERKNLKIKKGELEKLSDKEIKSSNVLTNLFFLPLSIFGTKKKISEISGYNYAKEMLNIHKTFICPICKEKNFI